ncbi:MAG: hypothetical protein ACREQI_01585 [Candidatus Binataceae bacterium]
MNLNTHRAALSIGIIAIAIAAPPRVRVATPRADEVDAVKSSPKIETALRVLDSWDIVTTGQFFDSLRARSWTGEQLLVCAVLRDAVDCLFGQGWPFGPAATLEFYPGSLRWHMRREARAWIFTAVPERPFSFTWCCAALNLDSDWLRDKLKREESRRREGIA